MWKSAEDDRDIAPWEHISVGLGQAIDRCATAYMRNCDTSAEPDSDQPTPTRSERKRMKAEGRIG